VCVHERYNASGAETVESSLSSEWNGASPESNAEGKGRGLSIKEVEFELLRQQTSQPHSPNRAQVQATLNAPFPNENIYFAPHLCTSYL